MEQFNKSTEDEINKTPENTDDKKSFIKQSADSMNLQITKFGEYICSVLFKILILPVNFFKYIALLLWRCSGGLRSAILSILNYVFYFIMSPFIKIQRSINRTKASIKKAKQTRDKRAVLKIYMIFIKNAIFGKRGLAVTAFNYVLPVICLSFLLNIVTYATNINYAVKLTVNGQYIGYIESEQIYDEAELIMQKRITYMSENKKIELEPEFSLEKVGYQELINKSQLSDILLSNADVEIEYAYGLYIGDAFYGALVDNEPVSKALDSLLDKYRTGAKDEEVSFEKSISFEKGFYLSESIVDEKDIINLLTSTKTKAGYYTIVEDDVPLVIAEKLGITYNELCELNPKLLQDDVNMVVGEKLLTNKEVPFLNVSISNIQTYEVSIPYETEYITDDDHYQGVQTDIQDGVNGTNRITARVAYVNGEETRRTIISTEQIKVPTTKIVSEGTLAPQSSHYSSEAVEYNKKYIWPVEDGYFLEWGYWDGGYWGHTGVDIGSYYGADVYAGASGTVVYVGDSWDGYGLKVMIEHDDGYTTLYAHNSDACVYVGQYVTQGQCIGAVGSTGDSSCNHVHFEVRWGSERLNPRYYLNGL